jgi:predicted HicB family RNase H-like nuclease
MLTYRGYSACVEINEADGVLLGQVLDLNDSITFEGRTVEELRHSFEESIDSYLEYCSKIGKSPDKPFSGKISYRTDPETHRKISLAASHVGLSINGWMDETLKYAAEYQEKSVSVGFFTVRSRK